MLFQVDNYNGNNCNNNDKDNKAQLTFTDYPAHRSKCQCESQLELGERQVKL